MPSPVSFDFALKPKAAIDYLNNKGYQLSFNYDELAPIAHHNSFTVAKVTRLDLLHDIFNSIDDAAKNGKGFEQWQDELKPTLKRKGWWGKQEITDPKTGEVKEVYIGSRRLRTIYQTNMRVAYNVQRNQSQRQLTTSVYWRYRSMMLPTTRAEHAQIHGTVLHRDDPFWSTNYPPNGWGCQCKVQAYSQKQLDKRGIKVSEHAPESIADKDWRYDIGAGSRLARLNKMALADNLPSIAANPDLDSLTDEQLKARFYERLGMQPNEMMVDQVGDPMWLTDDLFKASMFSKLRKRERHLYFDAFADVIKDPDEIYLERELLRDADGSRLVKKMFKYFEDDKGKKRGIMAIFGYEKDKTIGVSVYAIDNQSGTEKRRIEKLVYQKAHSGE